MPRELFKGDRNKIELVGLYPRGKRRLYSAVAYDGRCYLKKGKYRDNTVMKRTGTADYNQALAIAQKWIEDLRKQWDRDFGASPGKAKGQLTIEDELNVILERIRLEKGEESLTYREYRFEADALFRHMGESRKLPPAQHTGPEFERLVAYRMAELESQASRSAVIWRMRYLCKQIPHLPAGCLEAIHVPNRPGPQIKQECAFLWRDIVAMGKHLARASNTVKILILSGACTGQHIGDIIFLTWAQYDEWKRPGSCGHRRKTGVRYRNRPWEEVMASIDERERRPGDVYVCPDIVFGKRERKDPNCNKRKLSLFQERQRAGSVKTRAYDVLNRFLVQCGIKRPGISYKSFRCYDATVGLAANFPHRLLMDFLGLTTYKSLMVYANSTEEQVEALSEFLRKHWLLALKGKKQKFVLSLTEAVDIIQKEFRMILRSLTKDSAASIQSLRNEVAELRRKISRFVALLES